MVRGVVVGAAALIEGDEAALTPSRVAFPPETVNGSRGHLSRRAIHSPIHFSQLRRTPSPYLAPAIKKRDRDYECGDRDDCGLFFL
jgi:hypothetical protein